MEHKDKLPMVEAFILEIQRLANLVPLNAPHTSNKDFVYKGYIFPKGAIVFGVLDSVLNDPEIFPEPSNFKPERFLNEDGKCFGEQKDKLIPFSIGTCIYLKYTANNFRVLHGPFNVAAPPKLNSFAPQFHHC
jgi:cytochrome P450